MPTPPSAKRSETSGGWRWRPNCEPRSRNCLRLREQSDQPEAPDGLVVRDEIARREDRLARLAEAKALLEARAAERAAAEQAEYEAKLAQREEGERGPGTETSWPPTDPTDPRTARGRPVQLYRPGVAHHEKLDACGLRARL